MFVPMRDGVRLSTDLYFPVGVEGKVPVILVRTPYGKEGTYPYGGMIPLLVQQGYIVAIQDARGRYESEGRYRVRYSDRKDGYDTIEWLIHQPWSDGQIATFGCSYLGETQVTLAAEKHPNHVAMMPMASGAAYNDAGRPFTSFDGGVLELAQTAGWFMSSGSTVFHGPPAWIDRQEWFQSEQADMFNTVTRRQDPCPTVRNCWRSTKHCPSSIWSAKPACVTQITENFVTSTPESDYFDEGDWIRTDDTFDAPALYIDSWYDFGAAESIKMLGLPQNLWVETVCHRPLSRPRCSPA